MKTGMTMAPEIRTEKENTRLRNMQQDQQRKTLINFNRFSAQIQHSRMRIDEKPKFQKKKVIAKRD